MNPLMVAGDLGERIDPLLRDDVPVAQTGFLADERFQLSNPVYDARHLSGASVQERTRVPICSPASRLSTIPSRAPGAMITSCTPCLSAEIAASSLACMPSVATPSRINPAASFAVS